jgi:hypothetical protein
VIDRIRGLVKKAPPQKERLQINELIREVIEMTHGEAVKRGAWVKTDLAEYLPLVPGDPGQGYARVTLSRVIWLMFSAPTCRMIVMNSSSRIWSTRSTPASPNEASPHT